MPAAARTARAFNSVPDFAAPTEILFPFKSAKVFILDPFEATICT